MTIAFEAKRAYVNTTGLGSYARNHLAMTASLPDVQEIFALTPSIKISDTRLKTEKIQTILPKGLWQLAPLAWRRFGLGRVAQRVKADIFHGLSAELPADIRHFKGKVVVTIHDVLFRTRPNDYTAFDRWMHDYKLKQAIASAHHIVCISQETLDQLCQHYIIDRSRCTVMYQSVHPEYFSAENCQSLIKPPYKNFILCVGTIEPRKNTLSLLNAVEKTRVPLVLIGRIKKKYKHKVQPLLSRLSQKNLLFHTTASRPAEIAAWYYHSEFTVYPSVAEGFGLPPLESAAAGRACITGPSPCLTESSGLPELQTDGSPEQLADLILQLWNDKTLLSELHKRAKSHAENFRPEIIRHHWEHFYRKIL